MGNNESGTSKRSAIYCADISHSRFATGGGDGRVKIWSLDALFDKKKYESIGKFRREEGIWGRGVYESSDTSESEDLAHEMAYKMEIRKENKEIKAVEFDTNS